MRSLRCSGVKLCKTDPQITQIVMITIAIAKGRMQDSALALLARAGIRLSEEAVNSRRLALTDETGQYRFIFVKPADVPVYVEHGIADCGVVGRDVLLESEADLLLPLDLGIARCRIVVAAARCGGDDEGAGHDSRGHQVFADRERALWRAWNSGRDHPAFGFGRTCAGARTRRHDRRSG